MSVLLPQNLVEQIGKMQFTMSDVATDLTRRLANPATTVTGGLVSWARRYRQNATVRAVAWLAQRHIAARAISGLAILISAFVFTPTDFATFGIFLAILNPVGLLIFLRYDAVLISATNENELCGAICLNLGVMVLTMTAMASLTAALVVFGVVSPVIAMLFIAALGFRGLQRIMGAIVTRQGDFRLIGQMSMIHAASLPATIVTVWLADGNGAIAMIVAEIIANVLAATFLYWHLGHVTRAALTGRNRLIGAIALARDWAVLPRVNLPGALLAACFAQLPLVVVVTFASPEMAGHLALLFRVMDFPVQLIMAASAPVLMNRLSKGSVQWASMPKIVAMLAGAVFAIYGLIVIGSFMIEPWTRATSWSGICGMVATVAVFQGAIAFSGPLIDACSLYRQQTRLMTIHATMLVLLCLAFLLSFTWMMALALVSSIAALRAGLVATRLLMLSKSAMS